MPTGKPESTSIEESGGNGQGNSTKSEKITKGFSSRLQKKGFIKRLEEIGVEARGVKPVPVEERQDRQFFKIFFLWFSANVNILSFSSGTLGPAVFGLGIRDSCLTILFFELIFCAMPAYVSTWGPKLGMRQMVTSRYSFGYYGVWICCLLNLVGLCGFSTLNCILGGQALASVSDQNLSWTVGIVVIGVVALSVSFCGYIVLGWYVRVAWIPVLITFVIVLGVGGKHLGHVTFEPASAQAILKFASTLAGYTVTYTPLGSDFTTYFREDVKSSKIFLYSYLGLTLSIISLQCIGAAVVASVASVPSWEQSYSNGDVGGLLGAVLQPVHGFGKFLTVLLSLSVIGNMANGLYSISLNLQLFVPYFSRVPRYIFSTFGAALIVALAITGQHRFYDTIVNFSGLLAYWAGPYVIIIFLEHLYFRKGNFKLYDPAMWNSPSLLPTGIAAVVAMVFSLGLVVPCMDQVWYVGPVAKRTGDIGFEVAFVASAIFYFLFRRIEIQWRGRL